jgi:RHS repeat-associated protein
VFGNIDPHDGKSRAAGLTGFRPAIPVRERTPSARVHYHRNQQYSIAGLTNAAGTLVDRYTYSAYGTLGIPAANGTVRTSSTYANRYTYTGREYDAELNLYHFRARWYDPATGGFVSRDPLGYVDGESMYRGCFAVKYLDPLGEDTLDILGLDYLLGLLGTMFRPYACWSYADLMARVLNGESDRSWRSYTGMTKPFKAEYKLNSLEMNTVASQYDFKRNDELHAIYVECNKPNANWKDRKSGFSATDWSSALDPNWGAVACSPKTDP